MKRKVTPAMGGRAFARAASGFPNGFLGWAAGVGLGLAALPATAAVEIDIHHAPVFLLSGAPPNFILTLDNSSSMGLAHSSPDVHVLASYDARDTSAETNAVYYDPKIVYLPPMDWEGRQFPHADFTAAPRDFFAHWTDATAGEVERGEGGGADTGCALDLSRRYAPLWEELRPPCTGDVTGTDLRNSYSVDPVAWSPTDQPDRDQWTFDCLYGDAAAPDCPAFYHIWDSRDEPRGCGELDDEARAALERGENLDCLVYIPVGSDADIYVGRRPSAQNPGRTISQVRAQALMDDADGGADEDAEEGDGGDGEQDAPQLTRNEEEMLAKRNFANWFAYYRNRLRTLQTSITRVTATLDPRVRVTYQNMDSDQPPLANAFGPFDGTRRQAFQRWLFERRGDGWGIGTNLIPAALDAEAFCSDPKAYLLDPGMDAGALLEESGAANEVLGCRNNFHLMFTDGAWESVSIQGLLPDWVKGGAGNVDGTAQGLPHDWEYALDAADGEDRVEVRAYGTPASGTLNRIYGDNNVGGLADVVFHAWITDLLADDGGHRVTPLMRDLSTVPDAQHPESTDAAWVFWNPKNDPATWQHITTFTVGMGVMGKVSYPQGTYDYRSAGGRTFAGSIAANGFPGEWDAVDGAEAGAGADPEYDLEYCSEHLWDELQRCWCVVYPDDPDCVGEVPDVPGVPGVPGVLQPDDGERVDDLWHAGINGRGGYSSATDPASLIAAFQEIVDLVSSVARQEASGGAPAFNTGTTSSSRMLFHALMDSTDWTGDLHAYHLSWGPTGHCPEKGSRGELCNEPGNPDWKATDRLDAVGFDWQARQVLTAATDGGSVVTRRFLWEGLQGLGEPERRMLVNGVLADANPAGGLEQLPADLPEHGGDGEDDWGTDYSDAVSRAELLVDYLRGQRDYEAKNRPADAEIVFRDRNSLMGDIFRAAPVVVGRPSGMMEADGYAAYRDSEQGRTEIVYTGANDGMLHAFAVETGAELFAYIPRPLLGKLATLGNTGYGDDPPHTSFLDGAMTTGEVFFRSAATPRWSPVVVGGLGRGARAVFAIRSPSCTVCADLVDEDIYLWDYTHPDLGTVIGKPSIVRVLLAASGAGAGESRVRWAAVFGNGYNSPGGGAMLFVVDMEDGSLIAKFDTETDRDQDPWHAAPAEGADDPRVPNGLSQPTVLGQVLTDSEGNALAGDTDPVATVAYAGDMFGNLWRFNLAGAIDADGVSGGLAPDSQTKAGEAPVRLFSAKDETGRAQPITAGVAVVQHPTAVGTLVLFGTGRFLGTTDTGDMSIQSFYGIWDKGTTNPRIPSWVRSSEEPDAVTDLLVQTVEDTEVMVEDADSDNVLGRVTSDRQIDWSTRLGWVIDLVEPNLGGSGARQKGERVVTAPEMRGDERIVFVSMLPSTTPCEPGGYSWVNALDYRDGSRLDYTPFDYDLNGRFDEQDSLDSSEDGLVVGSSIRFKSGGIYSGPASLPLLGGTTKTVVATSEGDLIDLLESNAFQWRVWRQLLD